MILRALKALVRVMDKLAHVGAGTLITAPMIHVARFAGHEAVPSLMAAGYLTLIVAVTNELARPNKSKTEAALDVLATMLGWALVASQHL